MKSSTQRPIVILCICAVATLLFVVLWARGFLPLQQVEFFAQDWQMRLGRKTPTDDRVALIGIDQPIYEGGFSNEELQREPLLMELQSNFPWSRRVWARMIEKLAEAGAKAIVIDLVFATPGDGDDELKQVLDKYKDRVVIGYNINVDETENGKFFELLLPNKAVIETDTANTPVEDARLGYVTIWTDFDDTLRRVSFRKIGDDGVVMESLDARALRAFGRADTIPTGYDTPLFRYSAPPDSVYKAEPIGDVLSPKQWDKFYRNGAFFKDKIILIGPTAEIFHDAHDTPFINPDKSKRMSGPEIHVQIMNAALHGEFLRETSLTVQLWIIACLGAIALALCFVIRQPAKRLLVMIVLIAGYLVLTQSLFNFAGYVLPVAVPLIVLVTSSIIALAYDFLLERMERMMLKNTMGLYFSPRVLEAVLADPGSMRPRSAEVTILLTDLRNSTKLAELLGPQGMFDLLNRVFEAQTSTIMAEEGNLEHFLGDQFLSYWGAPQAQLDAADRASRASIKLITAMEQVRPSLAPEVQKLFGYGVALHSGAVLVGNKGSAQRLDYGLVGDTVNEAARIEALTKYYGVKWLISGVTLAQCTTARVHRLVDRVIVKGKSEPVELFECENPCTIENFAEICELYQMAYLSYADGHFMQAQANFKELVTRFADGPSKILSARCIVLIQQAPAQWKGIWQMDTK